jgi:hypothetical protein
MGILNGIFRTITSPIEIAARTVSVVFENDFDIENPITGVDIATFGATRVIRKGSLGIKETFDGIIKEFEE